MRLIDYLDKGAELGRDAICIVYKGRTWTYGAVFDRTHRIASACAAERFGVGSKAAILSPNHPDALAAILGVLRAEITWLPINPRYTLEDIIDRLRRFDCDSLIVDPSFEAVIDRIRGAVARLSLILSLDDDAQSPLRLDTWIAPEGARHESNGAQPEALAAIMATGGTTGRPKGVMQTNRGSETYVANHIAVIGHSVRPRYLVVAPMTHAAGFRCFPMLARGGTIVVLSSTDLRSVSDAMERHGITDLFLPPTLIYMMLADGDIRAIRFLDLMYLLYGAAPMAVEKLLCTALRPEDHFIDGEIAGPDRLSSCGRSAPFSMLAVMDDEGGLLAVGEVGEIVVRAGNVMAGYYNDPESTMEASRHGWHHTGDPGYHDEQDFYHLVDRARDLIISGGYNIYPSEVEQVFWSHPLVQDCAVVGAPDPKLREAVTAVVQLKAGQSVLAGELITLCRQRLGPIKAPKTVLFWPDLPRSPVGKVLKREIRDRLWADKGCRI